MKTKLKENMHLTTPWKGASSHRQLRRQGGGSGEGRGTGEGKERNQGGNDGGRSQGKEPGEGAARQGPRTQPGPFAESMEGGAMVGGLAVDTRGMTDGDEVKWSPRRRWDRATLMVLEAEAES